MNEKINYGNKHQLLVRMNMIDTFVWIAIVVTLLFSLIYTACEAPLYLTVRRIVDIFVAGCYIYEVVYHSLLAYYAQPIIYDNKSTLDIHDFQSPSQYLVYLDEINARCKNENTWASRYFGRYIAEQKSSAISYGLLVIIFALFALI